MNGLFPRKRERNGLGTAWIMLRYHEDPWYHKIARALVKEVVGRSFDVCNWFSYLASATPYRDTHARVKSKPRWRPLKIKKYSDILRSHLRYPSKFRDELKFDRVVEMNVNRSLTWKVRIKEREIVNKRLNIDYIILMSIASVYTFTSTVITTDIIIKSFRETLIIYTYRKTRA